VLNWEWRSSIALTVARAVAAIHSAGPESCHGNIKSSNVLLTSDHEARLSEHGLHTLVGMSFSAGSSGYLAPEVALIARHTTKRSDVYSFGVLLLELLTAGKCPDDQGVDFPGWVLSTLRGDWTTNLLDAGIIVHEQQANEMLRLMHLAVVCYERIAIRRPAMSEVVRRMEDIRRSSCFHRRGSAPAETSITPGKETDERPAIFDVHSASALAATSMPMKETELEQSSDASANETWNKLASEEESTGMILASASTIEDSVVLGRGTFGTTRKVVKGDMTGMIMQDDIAFDQHIAATKSTNKELVLKLMQGADLREAEFDQRVAAIKAVKSDLLVPLHYWHRFSNGDEALVYSYMPTGCLSALLHGKHTT